MDENLIKKISIIFLVITIIINIATYMYLPGKIGMHVNNNGTMDNYIPKMLFVLVTPVLIIAIWIFSFIYKASNKFKVIIVETVFFIGNIWIIFSQLKI